MERRCRWSIWGLGSKGGQSIDCLAQVRTQKCRILPVFLNNILVFLYDNSTTNLLTFQTETFFSLRGEQYLTDRFELSLSCIEILCVFFNFIFFLLSQFHCLGNLLILLWFMLNKLIQTFQHSSITLNLFLKYSSCQLANNRTLLMLAWWFIVRGQSFAEKCSWKCLTLFFESKVISVDNFAETTVSTIFFVFGVSEFKKKLGFWFYVSISCTVGHWWSHTRIFLGLFVSLTE